MALPGYPSLLQQQTNELARDGARSWTLAYDLHAL